MSLPLLQCGPGKVVHHRFMHQEAGRRDADLPGVAPLVGGQHRHGLVDIRVLEHDRGRVPAELHGDALHVLPGEAGQLLADGRRARERHLANIDILAKLLPDIVYILLCRHYVDDALREPRTVSELGKNL